MHELIAPYVGHWLHAPPRFQLRVWYPILICEDGSCELIDAFSAMTTTKHSDPGSKQSAFILRNSIISSRKNKPKSAKYFGRLSREFLVPINLSIRARKMILRLNKKHLDGWEYDSDVCIPCDRFLDKEVAPQLRGKLMADPTSIFAGG